MAGLDSYMSAVANISTGDYSSEIVGAMLDMPRLSERAFIHNSLLMLERRDINGTLARERR